METIRRGLIGLITGITFVVEMFLAHYDIDVPQQPHAEHEYPAPKKPVFTLVKPGSGSGKISIIPGTGSMEITGLQPL